MFSGPIAMGFVGTNVLNFLDQDNFNSNCGYYLAWVATIIGGFVVTPVVDAILVIALIPALIYYIWNYIY